MKKTKNKKIKTPYRIPIAPPSKNHGDKKKYDRKQSKQQARKEARTR